MWSGRMSKLLSQGRWELGKKDGCNVALLIVRPDPSSVVIWFVGKSKNLRGQREMSAALFFPAQNMLESHFPRFTQTPVPSSCATTQWSKNWAAGAGLQEGASLSGPLETWKRRERTPQRLYQNDYSTILPCSEDPYSTFHN